MMILAAGLAPARAAPARLPLTPAASTVASPFLLSVRHHGHRWHGRHRRESWSAFAPPYGPAPVIEASDAPPAPPAPSVSPPQPPAAAPARNTPDRGDNAAVSTPSIEWVNPDRAAR